MTSDLPSLKSIEHSIDKYRIKNVQIEPATSIKFSVDLKRLILSTTDDDRIRAVSVLATIIRFSHPNDAFVQVFDEHLLDALFKTISHSTGLDIIKSILKILSSVVTGVLFESATKATYIIPLLNSVNINLAILEVLAQKLYLENVDMMIDALNFINGYLDIDHMKLSSINHLAEFILHLQRSEFLLMLAGYSQDPRFQSMISKPMDQTQSSFQKMNKLLLGLKVDATSKYQLQILDIILNQVTNTETEVKRKLILEKFSLFHLIDLYFFLESTNISFKKAYHQQVLFNSNSSQKFPLPLASLYVSNFLSKIFNSDDDESKSYSEISKHFFLRDLLQYNILAKFLEIWVDSKAERDDFDNICVLIELMVKHVNDHIDPEGELVLAERIVSLFKEISYKDLRQLQLNNYKKNIIASTKNETSKFNKMLNEQVFEFVKNQRFLQLAKGSWVYADLPSFKNSSQSSSSCYFIILSPNFKQLLHKEYKSTTQNTPDIDKTGQAIDITSIANFDIEEIHQVDPNAPPASSSSRLINLVDKTIINKITLLNRKNKKLFSFYAKKEDSLKWLDGLNLLIGNYDRLSDGLRDELRKLYEIRRTVQLLNFDQLSHQESLSQCVSEEDDKKVRDLHYLEGLSTGFYYT